MTIQKLKAKVQMKDSFSTPLPADECADLYAPPKLLVPLVSDLILSIRELYRQRQDLLNAEGNLTRQLKAIDRRSGQAVVDTQSDYAPGDQPFGEDGGQGAYAPQIPTASTLAAPCLLEVKAQIHKQKLVIEKKLAVLAKQLPAHSFVESVHGFGTGGFAMIVGEAGDLSLYANPAKLWKRMGLGLVNGERQRKCKDAEKAEAHGYSPRRRSVMWQIGDSMIKKQNDYRELYLTRKAFEEQKVPESEKGTKGLWHNRAKRYMEKRLLRDLWKHWNHS